MFKKNLFLLVCIVITYNTHIIATSKAEQLQILQQITQKVQRMNPTGAYFLTVPSFVAITTEDIEQFFSGIPSNVTKKNDSTSLLTHVKKLWNTIVKEIETHQDITDTSREALIEIRSLINEAYKHDFIRSVLKKEVQQFLEQAKQQNNTLIIRKDSNTQHTGATAYAVKPHNVEAGIAHVLTSYFGEQAVKKRILEGKKSLTFDLIAQAMVTEDYDAQSLIVSGISCSSSKPNGCSNLITIQSKFGHTHADDSHAPYDTYFIHDQIVYPIIVQKENRIVSEQDGMKLRTTTNPKSIQHKATLDPEAAQEIARITDLLTRETKEALCIQFIKRDNTIYIINSKASPSYQDAEPSYFDPRYIKKLKPQERITITPIAEPYTLAIAKKREHVILAHDLTSLMQLLENREKPELVTIGFVKEKPSDWQQHRLKNSIPIVWSKDFATIRQWVEESRWPLIVDAQHKMLFQFTRKKGFCTLFQVIEPGIIEHPSQKQVSALPHYLKPLNKHEKNLLHPDEFYSGVRRKELFKLLKSDDVTTAKQALNTLLFRIKTEIKRDKITKKECVAHSEPFDDAILKNKITLYGQIERVAYQLFKQLDRWKNCHQTAYKKLDTLFLVNMLYALVYQEPHDRTIQANSIEQLKSA